MNAPLPCRVSADLRRFEANEPAELTQDELDAARDSIAWDILQGRTVAGFDLTACLDCEFNSDGYTGTVNDLATLMRGEDALNAREQATATACAVHGLAYRIVARHVPESAVSERAEQYRVDKAMAS